MCTIRLIGRCLVLASLSAGACSAWGQVFRPIWRQVTNTVGNPGADAFAGAVWNSMNQYTFDLILRGAPGQLINGINIGDANAPTTRGLYMSCSVFNHPLGGNVESTLPGSPPLNAIPYDTFVDLGGTTTTPVISFVGGVDLSGTGGVIRAHWRTAPSTPIDSTGEMRIMRVTTSCPIGTNPFDPASGAYLGTGGVPGLWYGNPPRSTLQVELGDGGLREFVIGNAFELVPTPGATALFGLAGLAGLRRRR